LSGDGGELGGYLIHPAFDQRVSVTFRFSPELSVPPENQVRVVKEFFNEYSNYKQVFFDAVRSHYLSNSQDYFLEAEMDEMHELLELPIKQLEAQFEEPGLNVYDGGIIFGFYSCAFDSEHGCALRMENGQVKEIATFADLR
jgi:hypothetical protein